jgi:hypothetical protein
MPVRPTAVTPAARPSPDRQNTPIRRTLSHADEDYTFRLGVSRWSAASGSAPSRSDPARRQYIRTSWSGMSTKPSSASSSGPTRPRFGLRPFVYTTHVSCATSLRDATIRHRRSVDRRVMEAEVSDRVRSVGDLLDFVIANPSVARRLKDDPQAVAEMFEIRLSDDQAALIRENLDLDQVFSAAQAADSMVAKVATGIGLRSEDERER